jgi:hypothetical protein
MECDGARRVVIGNRIEIGIEVVGFSDPLAGLLRWAGVGGARPTPPGAERRRRELRVSWSGCVVTSGCSTLALPT